MVARNPRNQLSSLSAGEPIFRQDFFFFSAGGGFGSERGRGGGAGGVNEESVVTCDLEEVKVEMACEVATEQAV